ncbi:TPA: hypothetical protein ACHVIG_001998, partial [Streptococcus suis]
MKTSIIYQLFFIIFTVWLGYCHIFLESNAVLPLLFALLFLFIEFILVKIITIKTKFLRTCLWTLRLVQLQNFFLIEEGVIPLL